MLTILRLIMIITIPFNVPWVWSTDYLNQTALELAKRGNHVVCLLWEDRKKIWSLTSSTESKVKIPNDLKNVHILFYIQYIPFIRFSFIQKINQFLNLLHARIFVELLALRKKTRKKIFWIFDPNLFFIYKYFGKAFYLLYDCVDFFAIGSPEKVKQTILNERVLCTAADQVVANSIVLQKHLHPFRKNVGLVPQGFRLEGFRVKKDKYINLKLNKPVIGFVGGINNRLDMQILFKLVKNNPKWNFVLWGPTQKDLDVGSDRFDKITQILKSSNVKTGSSTDKEEVPGIISQFDIGIIPYDISQDFNKNCYPMKLFEFFYLGKPVVSTDITELRRFPALVKIGNTYKDWQEILSKLVVNKWSTTLIREAKSLAIENSWENKIGKILLYSNGRLS